MHTNIGILRNTLEQMLAEAEDHGREGIQPMLTPEDVKDILSALKLKDAPTITCEAKPLPFMQKELEASIEGMMSSDYKERFRAEYIQTKIRYERLKAFNNKIEAAMCTSYKGALGLEMPKHDCPEELLREQQSAMGRYLHFLEVRAVIEGIVL